VSLRRRVAALERAAAKAARRGGFAQAIFFEHDPAVGGPRLLVAGPPDWKCRDIPPTDANLRAAAPVMKVYGAGMSWDGPEAP
jgi:hypothetical protein